MEIKRTDLFFKAHDLEIKEAKKLGDQFEITVGPENKKISGTVDQILGSLGDLGSFPTKILKDRLKKL